MNYENHLKTLYPPTFRNTLRLTFRVSKGQIELLSLERLEMICPPSFGERPKIGEHGNFWMELRDEKNLVLFHRILHSPIRNSIEVHSPDGKIERVFGEPTDNVFEVLLPDLQNAKSVVLIGESLDVKLTKDRKEQKTKELAQFEIPKANSRPKE